MKSSDPKDAKLTKRDGVDSSEAKEGASHDAETLCLDPMADTDYFAQSHVNSPEPNYQSQSVQSASFSTQLQTQVGAMKKVSPSSTIVQQVAAQIENQVLEEIKSNEEPTVDGYVSADFDAAEAGKIKEELVKKFHGANRTRNANFNEPNPSAPTPNPNSRNFRSCQRVIPHEDASHSSNSQQAPYEVEAMLVQETVFDAIPVPRNNSADDSFTNQNESWWKTHSLFVIVAVSLLFGCLTATIGAVIARDKNNSNEETLPSSPEKRTHLRSSTTSTTTSTLVTSTIPKQCVKYLGTLFVSNCATDCQPALAIYGDTAVVALDYYFLQFFSLENNVFEVTSTIDVDYYVENVAVYGNVSVAGAPFSRSYTGAVHLYERNQSGVWEPSIQIVSDVVVDEHSWFGCSVSIQDDAFVAGAHFDWEINKGFVNVYRRSGSEWALETTLRPNVAISYKFGASVSIQGDRVAVGEGNYVYLFNYNSTLKTWEQLGKPILNADCDFWFGSSVALEEDGGLLIGCNDESKYDNAGAVYYYNSPFKDEEYMFQQKITASDAASGDYFGGANAIAVDEDSLVVGTSIDANGKAYIFVKERSLWREAATITAPAGSGRYFGSAVDISQNIVLISSSTNVYTYELDIESC